MFYTHVGIVSRAGCDMTQVSPDIESRWRFIPQLVLGTVFGAAGLGLVTMGVLTHSRYRSLRDGLTAKGTVIRVQASTSSTGRSGRVVTPRTVIRLPVVRFETNTGQAVEFTSQCQAPSRVGDQVELSYASRPTLFDRLDPRQPPSAEISACVASSMRVVPVSLSAVGLLLLLVGGGAAALSVRSRRAHPRAQAGWTQRGGSREGDAQRRSEHPRD